MNEIEALRAENELLKTELGKLEAYYNLLASEYDILKKLVDCASER